MFGNFQQRSLTWQGMLLLALFLFLELCFCGSLYFLEASAEVEVQRETRYKEILRKTQSLQKLSWESMETLKKYAQTMDPEYSKRYDVTSTTTLKYLDSLKSEFQSDKQNACLADLEKIDPMLRKAHRLLRAARRKFDSEDPVGAAALLKVFGDKFTPEFNLMLKDLDSLLGKEEKLVSDTHPEQRMLRRRTMALLPAGFILNVLFAIYFASFFFRSITSPLSVLVDNTKRFKNNDQLNEPIQGATELVQLDTSFHDMAEAVREAQRMRQAFVAMISHDLRTPLTNVQAFLSLLSEGILGEVPELVTTEAQKTENNVSRLIRLINDLLMLEKMESGKMQMTCKVVYIENIIEKSIEAIEEFAKGYGVTITYDETNAEAYADPDRLIQVIINLASNAVKFSPKGETVHIKTNETADCVEVQVIDHGRGVPAEYREAIFEKYKQVKAEDGTKKGGTGLGLPICKLIVEQLGGNIGVNSEDGKGSTFWFRLPKVSTEKAL